MLEKVDICRYERQKLQRFFILQKHLQKLQEHISLIVSYLLALCSVQKTLCNICLWHIMSLNEQLRDMLLTRNALMGFVARDLNTKEQVPLGSLKRLWTDLCKAAVGIDSKGKKKKSFPKVKTLYGGVSEPQKITLIQEQNKQNTLNNPGYGEYGRCWIGKQKKIQHCLLIVLDTVDVMKVRIKDTTPSQVFLEDTSFFHSLCTLVKVGENNNS